MDLGEEFVTPREAQIVRRHILEQLFAAGCEPGLADHDPTNARFALVGIVHADEVDIVARCEDALGHAVFDPQYHQFRLGSESVAAIKLVNSIIVYLEVW